MQSGNDRHYSLDHSTLQVNVKKKVKSVSSYFIVEKMHNVALTQRKVYTCTSCLMHSVAVAVGYLGLQALRASAYKLAMLLSSLVH